MKKWIDEHSWIWPFAGAAILWIVIGVMSNRFSLTQLFSSATLASFTLLLALAQMCVITSGDGAIDLSTTYVLTLAAYLSCSYMNVNPILGIVIAIGAGVIVGVVNALINIYLKVPAMITTLAVGYITYSVILLVAPNVNSMPHKGLVKLINTTFGGVSVLTLFCIVITIGLAILLYKTKYGRQLHAVGQNRIAAKYAGVSVPKTIIKTFALSGAISAVAGVFCGAFNGGAFQDMGTTYFLPSVAAALVGGTLASGGKSSALGAVFGALMMSLMTTFLNITRLSPGYQKLIQGAVLVLILVVSVSKKKGEN